MPEIELFYLAHSRPGDKGNSQTMSLIPYRQEDYGLLAEQVTPAAVKAHFRALVQGRVTRYDLPNIGAFNVVLEEALQGGVNDSVGRGTHGKPRSTVGLGLREIAPESHPALSVERS